MSDFLVEHSWHEVRCPALNLVWCPGLAGQQRGARRLRGDNLGVRPCQADHLTGAGERAARAPARHKKVQPLAGEVLEDFGARGVAVIGRICRVVELSREKPTVLLRKL